MMYSARPTLPTDTQAHVKRDELPNPMCRRNNKMQMRSYHSRIIVNRNIRSEQIGSGFSNIFVRSCIVIQCAVKAVLPRYVANYI